MLHLQLLLFRWNTSSVFNLSSLKGMTNQGGLVQYRWKGKTTLFKMASAEKYKISPGMRLFWCGIISSISALVSCFIAFCSPYWYQSWRRVHSPLANVGLWNICLSGYVKPMDPSLQSFVGCWWIHSTFFSDVQNFIMPRK